MPHRHPERSEGYYVLRQMPQDDEKQDSDQIRICGA